MISKQLIPWAFGVALLLGPQHLEAGPAWWAHLRSVAKSAMGQAKGGRAQVGKDLELRVLSSGLVKGAQGRWAQQLTVQFLNLDSRRYHRQVLVLFSKGDGVALYRAKTFLSLAPGHSLIRRYRVPARLGCALAEACPPLDLLVSVGKEKSAPLALDRETLPDEPDPTRNRQTYAQQIVDGDTLILIDGERLRLLGVDTPELLGRDGQEQAFAREAAEYTRQAVTGVPLRITLGGEVRDSYGRLLALVYLPDGSLLNQRLLEAGLAKVYARAKHPQKRDFAAAQGRAKLEGKGIWATQALTKP